jgi:chorismate dehydratase
MKKISVSAVSYLNTLPFVYGIKNSGLMNNINLQLDIPSECARKFASKEVDIALVPVALLKKLDSYQLINDYCIGANGNVKTVLLLSQVPLDSVKKIHLDYHSLTSVTLVKVLAKKFWKINPEWIKLDKETEKNMEQLESVVAIGDKTFPLYDKFKFVYDFSTEWKKYTGLPFVFACWVAHNNVDQATIKKFTETLSWGVSNKKQAIEHLFDKQKFPSVNIEEYLEKNIDFIFDAPKHQALTLFLEYINEI